MKYVWGLAWRLRAAFSMRREPPRARAAPGLLEDLYRIAGNAWPVLIGQLALVALETIDTTMVGRYSVVDLAALGLGASI